MILTAIPLIRHRHLPKIASRYWATFGDDRSDQTKVQASFGSQSQEASLSLLALWFSPARCPWP
jgi:hypothetical protein